MAALFDNVPKLTREAVLKAVGSIKGGRQTVDVMDRLNVAGYLPSKPALWNMLSTLEGEGAIRSRHKGRHKFWWRAEE
jgi:hypothetical protein